LTLADRVVVLDRGQIQQIGSPDELYHSPENRFVASFIGAPSMNLFEANVQAGRIQLGSEAIDTGLDFSGPAHIGVRPEAIRMDGKISASVLWVENMGMHTLVGLRAGEVSLTALAAARPGAASVGISVDPKEIHVFEKDSGTRVVRSRGHWTLCS
jgi:multiple sugar transport system ATP-binding protein